MAASKKTVNINLIVKEDIGESFTAQILSWALTYGRYIIIITQIIVLSVFFLRFKLDRDHTDLKESVSQKQALVESISDLENEIKNVQNKLTHVGEITTNQTGIIKVLRFLQDHSPSNTSLSSLIITTNKISFAASAGNLKSFNYLLRQLQQDKRFSEITLENIIRKTDGRIEFQITSKIDINAFI